MKFQNPLTKNYDCHCGSKSATICRFRHWIDAKFGPLHRRGVVASFSFIFALELLAFLSGAPNRLNGCKGGGGGGSENHSVPVEETAPSNGWGR